MEKVYNCKHILYPHGEHVTFYKKPIRVQLNDTENEVDRFTDDYINNTIQSASFLSSASKAISSLPKKERTQEDVAHSLHSSASRSKNAVYQIARSNEWDWFITLTFRRDTIDASDYDIVTTKLKTFLNHLQQRKCPNLKYLIVPELHADKKNYHFHGLLADCDELHFVDSGHYDDKYGFRRPIYNIKDWSYGFTTATRVLNSAKASSYITKYITKDIDIYLKDKHRYYKSDNCTICEADKLLLDEDEFLEIYHDRIAYCKTVSVPQAYQMCTYYELTE